MWIKICGTTSLDDALLAANAGADAIGFVLAPSKRQVTPAQVAAITTALHAQFPAIETVGVLTTTDPAEILAAARLASLTAVQLHSAFNPTLIATLKSAIPHLRILQVVDCDPETTPDQTTTFANTIRTILATPEVDAILLDTSLRGTSGGTGITFDWPTTAATLEKIWPTASPTRLILAGGLNPLNVAEAIIQLHPDGVDVVTGTEAAPGRKNPALIKTFIAAARR